MNEWMDRQGHDGGARIRPQKLLVPGPRREGSCECVLCSSQEHGTLHISEPDLPAQLPLGASLVPTTLPRGRGRLQVPASLGLDPGRACRRRRGSRRSQVQGEARCLGPVWGSHLTQVVTEQTKLYENLVCRILFVDFNISLHLEVIKMAFCFQIQINS